MRKLKKANIIATLGIIITVLIFLAIFILFFQINIITNGIRKELFYISKNTTISLDKEELAMNNYEIDIEYAKANLKYLLNINLVEKNKYINNINIVEASFENNVKGPYMQVKIKVNFRPIIKVGNKDSYDFYLTEKTNIALFKYN